MSNWIKILQGYRLGKFDRYYYGLTPRMIIGVNQNPIGNKFESETEAKEVSRKLFEEMKEFNENGLIVTSNQCGIHNGPVLSLIEKDWNKNMIGVSFDDIWKRYGKEITDGNYGISQYDQKIIQEILNEGK